MYTNTDVQSTKKPISIDMESSKVNVFINYNISEHDGELGTYYTYDQDVYTKEEYYLDRFTDLDNRLEGYVDIDSLDLDGAKAYMLNIVGEGCMSTIYEGIDVTLLNGEVEHFSLTPTDQLNIQSQLGALMTFGIKSVAYHADGKNCRIYDSIDFLRIALYSSKYILEQTTYCNHLNNYIRGLGTKEEVLSCFYGMPLPNNLLQNIQDVVQVQMNELVNSITAKFSDIALFG